MKPSQPDLAAFIREQIEIYGDELALPARDLRLEAGAFSQESEEPWRKCASLQAFVAEIAACDRCLLSKSRNKLVFGSGNENAHIVLVGEAPGAREDQMGKPFVGDAGLLLDKILAAIQLQREQVYICNVLKCRPPGNRDPLPAEISQCLPYLEHQLHLIKPAFILCLGRHAAQTLLHTQAALSSLRGRVHDWQGIPLLVTYHPAALIRYPQFKRETWEDVQRLRQLYDQFLQNIQPS